MAENTDVDLSVSEELLAELHRRLDSHRASPEESEAWEIVEERIFGTEGSDSSDNQYPSANRSASRTSDIRVLVRVATTSPNWYFETVCTWSRLIAQYCGTPSSGPTTTSDRISRIVRVIGATVTSFRY